MIFGITEQQRAKEFEFIISQLKDEKVKYTELAEANIFTSSLQKINKDAEKHKDIAQ